MAPIIREGYVNLAIENKPENARPEISQEIQALAKPMGSACNLKCDYCFYLEKENLYHAKEDLGMPDEVMKAYIKNYIRSQPTPEAKEVLHE